MTDIDKVKISVFKERLWWLKFVSLPVSVLLLGFIVCLTVYTLIGETWDRPGKKVPDPAHMQNTENSLIWAVNIERNNNDDIDKIANDLDLINLGQVGELHNHYLFAHKLHANFSGSKTVSTVHRHHSELHSKEKIAEKMRDIEAKLDKHDDINWYSHQKVLSRGKRFLGFQVPYMDFEDPFYRKQWHLTNSWELGMDINVTGVWKHNITGSGVTVAVVDDGLEWNNPDLLENYNKEASYDLNDGDSDPTPNTNNKNNHHGTRCAGEISAVPNKVCGVGVAYRAKISGLKLLDGPLTDSMEADAFTKFFQINDIYSCSWGPDDDGKTVDGPHILAAAGMKHGIDFGRSGYGSIYVVASGNGGQEGDNCNYDGYANSLYTVTIGAVDETGHMPFYSEECASMLAVTFSSGAWGQTRDIVTTDWLAHKESVKGCTEHHSGTSAAAPIAAALIALMLDVQPCLTWRDIQYLIALTALKVDIDVAHWQKNGAGLWHSHKHGFGLMNAWRLVNAAKVWDQVPWQTSFEHSEKHVAIPITKGASNPLELTYTVTESDANGFDLYILETVQVTLTLDHPCRGNLDFRVKSPHGTMSVIGASRPHDDSSLGFDGWTFSTVRCWGESPVGTWTIIIRDSDKWGRYGMGTLRSWTLKLFGTPMAPKEFQRRKSLVTEALHGGFLNSTGRCIPPPVTAQPDAIMSVRILKVIAMSGILCFLFAVYESCEYLFCYNDEKKEQSKYMKLLKRAHRLAREHIYNQPSQTETTGLLSDNIPMQTFRTTEPERSGSAGAHSGSMGTTIIPERTGDLGEGQVERSSDNRGQVERSDTDDSLLQLGTCDVEIHNCNDEDISRNPFYTLNDDCEINTSDSAVVGENGSAHSLLSGTGAKGEGHSISDKLTALQAKVMARKQTKNGYSLLQNCSDESETEL
ncbi:proprotein convertase subtilisin/kexin type 7-like [Mercenaria mercenaria]|uniref:proprotein convertase subtilisin/kexin type 7-like n=1 Tax=Mercenaria mercenaria TaxID=6596 RepID=UPI00234F62F7|nr:proprotein convertase subtilisin/kexin type 7-like [Mercenaria mercenaria]